MKRQLLSALGLVISAGSLAPAFAVTPPTTNVFSPGVVTLQLSCSANKQAKTITVTNIDRLQTKIQTDFRIAWSGENQEGIKRGETPLASVLAPFKSTTIPVDSQFDSCKAAAVKGTAR